MARTSTAGIDFELEINREAIIWQNNKTAAASLGVKEGPPPSQISYN